MSIVFCNLVEIKRAAKEFLNATKNQNKFAFYGEMGAGKTTFINELLMQIGISGKGSSPTYSIVNEYESSEFGKVYHFDFYRLKDEFEALEIGVEDLLYGNEYCFMEWPEKIENLLPESYVKVNLTVENECRTIDIEFI